MMFEIRYYFEVQHFSLYCISLFYLFACQNIWGRSDPPDWNNNDATFLKTCRWKQIFDKVFFSVIWFSIVIVIFQTEGNKQITMYCPYCVNVSNREISLKNVIYLQRFKQNSIDVRSCQEIYILYMLSSSLIFSKINKANSYALE